MAVNSLTLNTQALTFSSKNLPKTSKLNALITADEESELGVTWSTTKASVATVSSDGIVTAVSIGSCTIKVTSTIDATKYATCVINVVDKDLADSFTSSTLNNLINTYGKRIVAFKLNDVLVVFVNYKDSPQLSDCKILGFNGRDFLNIPRVDGIGNKYHSNIYIKQIQSVVIADTDDGYVDPLILA